MAHTFILINYKFEWNVRVIILCVFAVILSVVFIFVSENKKVNELIMNINHKSVHDDIWQDIIDYDNGTTLRIVCGDTIYTGILVAHEEKGNDSWFVLEDYIVTEPDGIYEPENTEMNANTKIALPLKNVDRVELYYSK